MALLGAVLNGQAQVADTSKVSDDEIIVDHSDLGEFSQRGDTTVQKLMKEIQQVALHQDDLFMFCDTAILINKQLVADGNVIFQQGDSLSVFADSLRYDGEERLADLFGEIVLLKGDQQLFTTRMTYDLKTKVAIFREGATLTNDTIHLSSKRGYYYVDSDEAFFKDSVVVYNDDFILFSDTLRFDTEDRVATFLGPTLIEQDSAKMYTDAGYYDIPNEVALFTMNPQYEKGVQQALADTIRYNGKLKEVRLMGNARFRDGPKLAIADTIRYEDIGEVTVLVGEAHYEDEEQEIDSQFIRYEKKTDAFFTSGRARLSDPPQILEADEIDFDGEEGIASGKVIWADTAEQITVFAERADYNKATDFLLASGDRPMMATVINADTLYMRADTLIARKQSETDSARLLIAYVDVRIYKSDLQGVCDSLAYATKDSLFRFYDDPVLWSDTTQFTADTIMMQMRNEAMDYIRMIDNAFINNTTDEVLYNQIKGKNVRAFFKESELERIRVNGNAESVYYAQDEQKAYIGVNKTACSSMLIYFGSNEVDNIMFYAEPKGDFIPIRKAKHDELKLQGFRWEPERRPLKKSDL